MLLENPVDWKRNKLPVLDRSRASLAVARFAHGFEFSRLFQIVNVAA